MGDSIAFAPQGLNTDYGAQLTSAEQSIEQGVKTGQTQRAADAFAGLDINDPASTNHALAALVKAGAVDQAGAVQSLGFSRYVIGQKTGAISGLDSLYGGSSDQTPEAAPPATANPTAPPPAPLTPAQQAHAQAVMGFAKDSVDDLLGIADPAERAQAAQEIRAKAVNLGVPPQAVDSAIGDLSDQALKSQSEHYGAWLDHPSFGGQGEGAPPALHATTRAWTHDPVSLANPDIQKELARLSIIGVNIDPMVKALQAGQGYTGVVEPGDSLAKLGRITDRASRNPINPAPGSRVFNADTGGEMVGGEANPAPASVVNVGPAETPLIVRPTAGTASLIPSGGPENSPGGGAASPGHPGYAPTVAAPGVIAAATAHPAQYLGGLLGAPVRVSSVERGPEHNAAVGGAPGSEHIPGNGHAIDFAVPAGMSHDQVAAKILASGIPFDQLIFEANGSAHIGWGNGAQRGQVLDRSHGQSAVPGAGGDGMIHGKMVSAPFHPPGTPPGAMATRAPDGSLSFVPGTVVGAEGQAGLAGAANANPQVQHAQSAITAYNSLKANAGAMTGPAAMAMLQAVSGVTGDSKAVLASFGLPQEWIGKVEGFGGKSPLTPAMRQQILDAGYSGVESVYGQAAAVNAQAAVRERNAGLTPGSTQAPLGSHPAQFYISAATLPPASQRVINKTYDGPNGPHVWTVHGWRAIRP